MKPSLRIVAVRTPIARDLTAFLIDRQARGLSPRTVDWYKEKLECVISLLAVSSVSEVSPDRVRRLLIALSSTHSPGGVHAHYRALRAFLRWWAAETDTPGWLDPLAKVPPPRVVAEPLDPVPLPDLAAMLATCDKTLTGLRDRAILLCLLDTGARASEFIALDIDDIDLNSGAVTIRHGKGGKRRTVFLGAKARRELTRYWRLRDIDAGPAFTTDDGSRLTYDGLYSIMRRRSIAAGVENPGLHAFRRAFALASLRAGMDIFSLQKLMGHSDLSVLRRYLAQSEQDLQTAHRKAGPVDRLL